MSAEVQMPHAEWPKVALGELVEPVKTWNPSRSPVNEVFDYIDLSAVDQDAKLIIGAREVLCGKAPSRARQRVAEGDVLVSTVRPNLNGVARVPPELDRATASTGFCVLRAHAPKLDGSYLFHWVKTPLFVADMVKKTTGANYPAVSDKIIFDSHIPLPPLPEQRRIAEVLDRVEALRAKRRAAIAQLDSLTQSLFLDLFGDPATNPRRWPEIQLGKLCERVIDCPHSTPVYAAGRTEYPCVRSSDIQNGTLIFSDTKYVEKSEYEKRIARGKPQVGDIIYCREGARFGNAARITHEVTLCLGQRMMLFRPYPRAAFSEYLWAFLLSPAAYGQATSLVGGSASPHVNIRDIIALRVQHPPIDLQREFARQVGAVEKLKAAQRASLAELAALFASLQSRAFKGEL